MCAFVNMRCWLPVFVSICVHDWYHCIEFIKNGHKFKFRVGTSLGYRRNQQCFGGEPPMEVLVAAYYYSYYCWSYYYFYLIEIYLIGYLLVKYIIELWFISVFHVILSFFIHLWDTFVCKVCDGLCAFSYFYIYSIPYELFIGSQAVTQLCLISKIYRQLVTNYVAVSLVFRCAFSL